MNQSIRRYLSFWSLEPAYVDDRLRYHLGQVAMLEHMRRLARDGNTASAIICDPPALLTQKNYSHALSDRLTIRRFIIAAAAEHIPVHLLSEQINEERALAPERFREIERTMSDAYSEFFEVVQGISFSQQAREDLIRFRQPLDRLEDVPESLKTPLTLICRWIDLPANLLLPALYAFLHRPSWFEAQSLAASAAFVMCYTHRSHPREVVLLEARRNAYAWLTLEALYRYAEAKFSEGRWPRTQFIENAPAIDGQSYMELRRPEGCLFLDTPLPELTARLRALPPEVTEQFVEHLAPESRTWTDGAGNQDMLVRVVSSYRQRVAKDGLLRRNAGADPDAAEDVDLILKGGGLKGLALVGALEVLWPRYKFSRFLGTSAGAILTVLLAAGYTPAELRQILLALDFTDFLDTGIFRKSRNLILRRGLHSGEVFVTWLEERLKEKIHRHGPVRMRDLPTRAVIFAAQAGRGTIRFDSAGDNSDFRVAYAVRASMAIPLFFTPASHEGAVVYDGGVLNNFPLRAHQELFGSSAHIGIYLQPDHMSAGPWRSIAPRVVLDLYDMWTGQDEATLLDDRGEHVVTINPSPIRTTDFALDDEKKGFLLAAGEAAALRFLAKRGAEAETVAQLATEKEKILRARLTQRG